MKYIHLSVKLASESIQDKDYLETLAFNIIVKLKYKSSTINNATVRTCKSTFGIGSTRMSRIIKNGISYNLFRRDRNSLIANKINDKGYSAILTFENDRIYRLAEVMDIIRNTVLLNHIKIQTNVRDTANNARDPKSLKQMKGAKKKLERMFPNKNVNNVRVLKGLSNKSIMKLTNTKRTKAKSLIKRLVCSGKVLMEKQYIKTNIDPKDFYKGFAKQAKLNGCVGYLFLWKGAICSRTSNNFIYNCNDIVYS